MNHFDADRGIGLFANRHPRRQFLQWAGQSVGALPLLVSAWPAGALGAEEIRPLNRYPRMVHDYIVEQSKQTARRRAAELDRLKTKDDAERYVLSLQARIRDCFGPEPERTPLNPQITGVIERDGYKIEKVIFESRPKFFVTANLYVPTDRKYPLPGVAGSCGHSSNGKASEAYQSFALSLMKLGYVCLVFDPIGQGERLQYLKPNLSSQVGAGVHEHLIAGNQQHIVGESFWRWRAWDGVRALDYLLSRDEVDRQHVGITGNSGGGTMTTWLCGVDRRWTMAAPGCFVTTFLRNLENELPTDPEQCPPRALALGLDHSEFLAAIAPKPVIILAKERDFFDVRGAEEAYVRLRRLYALLGAEENIALFVGPTGHGYSIENREAMYSWFERAAGRKQSAPESPANNAGFGGRLETDTALVHQKEPAHSTESGRALQCTPDGQVAKLDGAKTVFDFTREKSKQLEKTRGAPRGDALRRTVTNILKLADRPAEIPEYHIWREMRARNYAWAAAGYAVETEPGIQAIVYRLFKSQWAARPPRSGPRAILYISHHSSDLELREEPLVRELVEKNPAAAFFTCDVRGIGDSWPSTVRGGTYHEKYGTDYFYSAQSLMLDRPYLGQKTYDVLRVVDWLGSLGHTDVHLVGRGWGALPATFAALFADAVNQVTLKNSLTSYADIAETEYYKWPLSAMLPDVLSHFDLPDCYAELKTKNLRQIDPWNGGAVVVN